MILSGVSTGPEPLSVLVGVLAAGDEVVEDPALASDGALAGEVVFEGFDPSVELLDGTDAPVELFDDRPEVFGDAEAAGACPLVDPPVGVV